MKKEYAAVIALLGFSSFYLHANAQDILFPGETERPSRYPLDPNNNDNGQWQNPNNNDDNGQWQDPNNNGNGQWQNPNNNNNGQPNNPDGGSSQQQYKNCVDKCRFTSEYNPVCGSDGVTYQNIGALTCAINCGNPIQNLGSAPCTTTTASPTVPPNNGQNFQDGITQQQYKNCVDNCRFTSEYNPLCGSDGVTYQNIGALNCAINCGNLIQNLGRAPCTTTTPSSAVTPSSNRRF